MADYFAEENKTVRCRAGKDSVIPLSTTACHCSKGCVDCTQNHIILLSYYGAVINKDGNYVY